MKRNTLVLFNTYWSNNNSISGGDMRLLEISSRIFKKDNVFCITDIKGKKLFEKKYKNANFIITPAFFDKLTVMPAYILRTIYSIYKMKDINKKHKIDLIYSPSDAFPNSVCAYIFKNNQNIWIQVVHHVYQDWKVRPGNKIVNFVSNYLQKFSFILIRNRANKIISVNKILKEHFIKMGFDKRKIYTSSNGIDKNYLDGIKEDNENYEGIFLARLNYSKGIFDLIKIWKIVCKKYTKAKLGIIGGGTNEINRKLLEEINENNLKDNIKLLGFLENKKAFGILKSSKVFLFPSHEEGWGIAVAEAMTCKIPVVSWDLPAYKEVFENNSIQIKENDIESFANKVIELLDNKKLRDSISEKAYDFVKKYSWDDVARKELEVIEHE
jgi:glycosyltransferase involved in cell wall biosynthesis